MMQSSQRPKHNRYFYLICLCLFLSSCSTKKKYIAPNPVIKKQIFFKKTTIKEVKQIVSKAKQQIGKPYQYGGKTPRGFDCSGLIHYLFSSINIKLPRTSQNQAFYGKQISIKIVQQGDLLFFGKPGKITHVGIVIDTKNDYPIMIHSSSQKGVIKTNLATSAYWKERFLYASKIL